MKSISTTIANILLTQGVIRKEDVDICRYGIDVFMSSVLEIASILIVALFVGNFFEAALLFTAFIPLRIYAGGYHADTRLKCYLISLCIYAIFTAIMNILLQEAYLVVSVAVTMFSLIVVLFVAPVIHKNKAVCDIEKKHYRKFSICICAVETATILLLAAIFSKSPYVVSLAIGQGSVTLSMIAAIVKGKIVDSK